MESLTGLYHWIRAWSAPDHQTMWVELQTIATVCAFGAAVYYAVLTRRLWKETSAQRQTTLMLQLMEEYDGLRQSIQNLQVWFQESLSASTDPVERFRDAASVDFAGDENVGLIDDSRFKVSRFFVKIRKLVLAGFLERRLVIAALSRAAIEDVFLAMVDPLDQVIHEGEYGHINVVDRDFYNQLTSLYPPRSKAAVSRQPRNPALK